MLLPFFSHPMHVCFVVSNPFALNAFLAPTIRALLVRGCSVTVVVNAQAGTVVADILQEITVVHLDIIRDIALLQDWRALWALVKLFKSNKYDIVHSITPKAGLLSMVASKIAGVKVRLHTFGGQVWVTRQGVLRWLLRTLDCLLAKCASSLLVDSASQRDFLINAGVAPAHKLNLLGSGSINGVDLVRFSRKPVERNCIRDELGIPADALVLLYLGRMNHEKGVVEVAKSFAQLAPEFNHLHLLLVGPDEGALESALEAVQSCRSRVSVIGLTNIAHAYMAAADIFCLASYREGFGLTLIEAAASGLPCVASKIYGITDAVVDGVTGLLVPARDVGSLSQALRVLISHPEIRQTMGAAGQQRAMSHFSQRDVVEAWLDFYNLQLQVDNQ